jgi:protein Mpv17
MFRTAFQFKKWNEFIKNSKKSFFSSSTVSNSLWQRYNELLVSHPIPTKCITGGLLAVIADITCQLAFPSAEMKYVPISERINWNRTKNFAIINTLFFPPIAHYWYGYLSVKIVGDTMLAAVKRVALDQILFAPVCLSGFFAGNLLLDGHPEKIGDKIKNDLQTTVLANYSVWVPAQLINFKFIPIPMRVLWANLVGFFWNIYLSKVANTDTTPVTKEVIITDIIVTEK